MAKDKTADFKEPKLTKEGAKALREALMFRDSKRGGKATKNSGSNGQKKK